LNVGSPFQECPKCRSHVSRPATNEWALLGAGQKVYWLGVRILPFALIGLVPALVYWQTTFRGGDGQLPVLVALLAAGPVLLAYLPLANALHSIRRSRARMADPMYRARLIAFGRQAPGRP